MIRSFMGIIMAMWAAVTFPTSTPTPTPTPASIQIQKVSAVKELKKVVVKRVIDGDTIELETGEKLRYLGINAAEIGKNNQKDQCFAKEAKTRNEELVLGKEVELEKDVSETDKYGRLLRYVWINGEMVNEKLVAQGFAQVATYPPDVKYKDRLLAAQKIARENKLGLWGKCK